MADPDDFPLEDAGARARDRAERYGVWLEYLRGGDPAFAEASALYPLDMSGWQSAVYLLTGNDGVWGELGSRAMQERSIGPVSEELESPRRPWASSQDAVIAVGGAFLGCGPLAGEVPLYVFEPFLFYGWGHGVPLRQRIPPALTVTGAGS